MAAIQRATATCSVVPRGLQRPVSLYPADYSDQMVVMESPDDSEVQTCMEDEV